MKAIRPGRFGEDVKDGQVTYFGGRNSADRMNVVRSSIENVRSNWKEHNNVPAAVRDFVGRMEVGSKGELKSGELMDAVERSFRLNTDWADRAHGKSLSISKDSFPILGLYTAELSYRMFFDKINQIYRSNPNLRQSEQFVPYTWIIELVNMELFKIEFFSKKPFGNGIVYRGTTFENGFRQLYERFNSPNISLEDRGIAVPLGLNSASRDVKVAHSFIEMADSYLLKSEKNRNRRHFAVIWNIYVRSLSEASVDLYKQKYEDSVISQICATDISEISSYPEAEVLLRGAWFDIIDFRSIPDICGFEAFALDAVMIDANRDHISTFELGPRDGTARKLFGSIVKADKYKICAELAETLGKSELASQYRAAAIEAEMAVSVFSER